MKETFWDKYRHGDRLEDFKYESKDCRRTIEGINTDREDEYMLEIRQKYSTDHILFRKDMECLVNGKNTGKVCWVTDIDFSMTADMFGGLILVLKDGDYLTIRMDGKITSFMNIPFEDLSEDKSEVVRKTVAEYTGDWRNFV